MWYPLFKYVLIGPALRLLTRPRVVGREHLPDDGPYIVAANHLAMIDSLILCLVLPRRLTFVAKREYFEGTGLRGAVQRWFFSASGQIPIDRGGAGAAQSSLDTACRILDAGGVWAIHPEGTRSRDGVAHRARTGVMRVAERTGRSGDTGRNPGHRRGEPARQTPAPTRPRRHRHRPAGHHRRRNPRGHRPADAAHSDPRRPGVRRRVRVNSPTGIPPGRAGAPGTKVAFLGPAIVRDGAEWNYSEY